MYSKCAIMVLTKNAEYNLDSTAYEYVHSAGIEGAGKAVLIEKCKPEYFG